MISPLMDLINRTITGISITQQSKFNEEADFSASFFFVPGRAVRSKLHVSSGVTYPVRSFLLTAINRWQEETPATTAMQVLNARYSNRPRRIGDAAAGSKAKTTQNKQNQ